MNEVKFNWEEIAAACGGKWLVEGHGGGIAGVVDDSRVVAPGNLFVAIRGELSDGHKYVPNAVNAGAGCVVVDTPPDEAALAQMRAAGCGCLLVADGLAAFQALAHSHRMRYPSLPLVGVTGSCGKTSTKEMCAAVLERRFRTVVKTQGNTNNFFGVPRNLLQLSSETAAAVVEMGSNHPGEIRRLAGIVQPKTGIVSNIGAAHLEFFGDLLGVAEEKGDLLEALPSDGVAVIPGEAVGIDILRRHAGSRRVVTFGESADNDMRCEYLGGNHGGYGLRLTWRETGESIEFSWHIGGRHQAVNAAGAAAVGKVYGLSLAEIAAGLKACELPGARMKIEVVRGVNWVNDAYNANPSSMRASLEWFDEISQNGGRRMLVLGDMLELGVGAQKAHEDVLAFAVEHFGQTALMTVGQMFAAISETRGIRHFATAQEAGDALKAMLTGGEWVFLKSSNGIGLSKISPESVK